MRRIISQAAYEWRQQNIIKKTADIIGLCIIFAGLGVSVFMNMADRSLWVDEAMLAYSFSERSIGRLTASPFEWLQSAPVLYLYLAKLLTLVFGNTEFVLRSFSVLSYAAVLLLTYYTARRLLGVRYGLLCAAFVANMNFMLKYSNVFKQYMNECVWVLLVLLLYYLYREGRLTAVPLTLLYMVFIWGANPACFFIGGVLVCELLSGIRGRDKGRVCRILSVGIGVFVSFVIYYFYWLRGTAASEEMQNYWAGAVFPLIPRSIADLKEAQALLYDIFITFREGRIFIMGLALAAFLFGIFRERNRYVAATAVGFFLALFASSLGMFPVADRMWCFSYPLFAMLAFMAVDRMIPEPFERGKGVCLSEQPERDRDVAASASWQGGELAAAILMLALILTNNGILVYRHAENVFWEGEEANAPIAYVEEHIQPEEKAYVYYHSIPVVKYKIGYDTDVIGDGDEDNVIWASGTANDSDVRELDAGRIKEAGRCYLIASHTTEERFLPLLQELQEAGNLEILQNLYETPLYYFSAELSGCKARASYELIAQEEEGDTCYATIRVNNIGESFINTGYDDVKLACREREDIGTNLWGNLEPGTYFDMPIQFDWNGDTQVSVQLRNGERYWYDELGAEPLVIRKGVIK